MEGTGHPTFYQHTHILGTHSVLITKPVPHATYSSIPSSTIRSLSTSHLKLALEPHLLGEFWVQVGDWGEPLVTRISFSS